MSKLTTIIRLLNEDGLTATVEAIADFYISIIPKTGNSLIEIYLIPLILIEEFHLLLTETAIAYPATSNKWVVFDLVEFVRSRSIISLFDRVSGTRHGSDEHLNIMQTIYTYNGFVEVEDGDIVVDVGSYVGAFSTSFSEKGSHIFAIDPLAKVSSALEDNMAQLNNISVVPKAAWNEAGSIEINHSFFPADNSILKPDQFKLGTSFSVDTDTVPNIVAYEGYDTVDFLKIEAEGAEPEVLQACLESDVVFRKIAIDVSEKQQTEEKIIEQIEERGYVWQKKSDSLWWGDKIIFARLP